MEVSHTEYAALLSLKVRCGLIRTQVVHVSNLPPAPAQHSCDSWPGWDVMRSSPHRPQAVTASCGETWTEAPRASAAPRAPSPLNADSSSGSRTRLNELPGDWQLLHNHVFGCEGGHGLEGGVGSSRGRNPSEGMETDLIWSYLVRCSTQQFKCAVTEMK